MDVVLKKEDVFFLRMGLWVGEASQVTFMGFMEREEPFQIDVEHQVPGNEKDVFVFGEIGQSARGSEVIRDGNPMDVPVISVFFRDAFVGFWVSNVDLSCPVFPKNRNLVIQQRRIPQGIGGGGFLVAGSEEREGTRGLGNKGTHGCIIALFFYFAQSRR